MFEVSFQVEGLDCFVLCVVLADVLADSPMNRVMLSDAVIIPVQVRMWQLIDPLAWSVPSYSSLVSILPSFVVDVRCARSTGYRL